MHLCKLVILLATAFSFGIFLGQQSQPTTFSTPSAGYVCKLLRGLYGAKQSPALWNAHLHEYLTGTLGFRQSPTDPCLYLLGDEQAAQRSVDPAFLEEQNGREDFDGDNIPDKEKGPFIALLAYYQ